MAASLPAGGPTRFSSTISRHGSSSRSLSDPGRRGASGAGAIARLQPRWHAARERQLSRGEDLAPGKWEPVSSETKSAAPASEALLSRSARRPRRACSVTRSSPMASSWSRAATMAPCGCGTWRRSSRSTNCAAAWPRARRWRRWNGRSPRRAWNRPSKRRKRRESKRRTKRSKNC